MASAVAIILEDQFGNVAIGDSSDIRLGINTGPGSLGGTLTVQAANGTAMFSDISLDTVGTYTLEASEGNLITATSNSFNVTPAAPSRLVFVQQPSSIAAGNTISPAVSVQVEDQFGNVTTSDSSSVTLAVGSGLGSLGGITTVQDSNGLVTFGNLSLTKVGSYTLQATDGGLTGATSGSFSVTPAGASRLVFVQQPTNIKAGGTINPAVTVMVEDPFGNVVPGDSSNVTVSVVNGSSSVLSGTLTEPVVNATATFGDLSSTMAGTYTLNASDGTLTAAQSGSFVVGVTVAAPGSRPTQLSIMQQTSAMTAGTAMPSAFVVNVEDRFGDLVTSDTGRVKLSVIGGPRGSAVRGTATVVAIGGVATFNNVFLNAAGNYTFQVKEAKLTVGTSSMVVVNPGAPVRLVYLHQPSNGIAGTAISPAVAVELVDRFRNIATNDNTNVTLSVLSGPVGASVGGTASAAAINGVATFSDVLLDKAGHYRLTAGADGVVAASKPITILPAAVANVSFMQQPGNVVERTQFTSRIQVMVTDAFGNPAANGTLVTLAIHSGPTGAVISGKPTAIAHKGIATFANVTFQTAGNYVLTASAGSVSVQSDSFSVLVTSGATPQLQRAFV
jgi:hypothetical protein